MTGIKLKLVQYTGWRRYVRIWWGDVDPAGHKGWSYHNAMQCIDDLPADFDAVGHEATDEEYNVTYFPRWPDRCDICHKPVPVRGTPRVYYSIFFEHLFDDPPRRAQPGDMYHTAWMVTAPDCFDVVLPVKMSYDERYYMWNTYQVASNCGHGNRQLHRCWSTIGQPPRITVNPSILYTGWHGFIKNGEIIDA